MMRTEADPAFLRHLVAAFLAGCLLAAAAFAPAAAQQPGGEEPAAEAAAPVEAPAEAEAPPELPPEVIDPAVEPEVLALRLVPLTKDELAAAAEAWQVTVAAASTEIAEAMIEAVTSEGEAAAEARAWAEELTVARNALFDRYNAVVDAWEKKGGDETAIAGFRAYRSAIQVEEVRQADFQTLVNRAVGWATSWNGGLGLLLDAAIVLAALLALFMVAGIVRGLAKRPVRRIPNVSRLLQAFLLVAIYWLTIAVGLMVVLSAIGVDVTPLFALVGGAAFILAFALQDTLGNLASGLMIMINRPFDEGDYVDVGGTAGTVQHVSIVSTIVTTPDNQLIVIPNSKVWGNVITNVTSSETRRVDLVFGVGYGDPIDTVQRALEDVVAAHRMVLDAPEPVIRVHALGESSVDFICRPWTRTEDYWTVYWDLTRQVKERFDAEGITIPFPQRDVHLHGRSPETRQLAAE